MNKPSGRFVLRLPPSLHQRAKETAKKLDLSLNEYCTQAVRSYVEGKEREAYLYVNEESPIVTIARGVCSEALTGVLVFGSKARGEIRESSDVDILVVVDGSLRLGKDLYLKWDEQSADSTLSPHFVHIPEKPESAGSIWIESAIDGLLLFEKGREMSRFLATIRRSIAKGDIEQSSAHGHRYWIRKSGG